MNISRTSKFPFVVRGRRKRGCNEQDNDLSNSNERNGIKRRGRANGGRMKGEDEAEDETEGEGEDEDGDDEDDER